ncbi:uncharacterized protein B0P05DRAFT_536756 [Gilbertella persicaria]|uniref:uncharacterized protein n=1 Tax=Gilbertella persicaria TaxID=101096 RepID=UPI00221F9266|nr:uncharacterized protein B0P05DRAFT_536756 [Gilbertella persicaria]KAI8083272.1 hypothetical protein B0P05DRAFT_536756 [Gilbertella persicaria]
MSSQYLPSSLPINQFKNTNVNNNSPPWITQYSEEETTTDDDYDNDDTDDSEESAVCGCGKPLTSGWYCADCRTNCSKCHRALAPEETCDRCSTS